MAESGSSRRITGRHTAVIDLANNVIKISLAASLVACAALGAVLVSPGFAAPIASETRLALQDRSATPAPETPSVEDRFAGAPDGVDPVVTGPVSAQFKQTRNFLGCDKAEWPNVPAGCYPD